MPSWLISLGHRVNWLNAWKPSHRRCRNCEQTGDFNAWPSTRDATEADAGCATFCGHPDNLIKPGGPELLPREREPADSPKRDLFALKPILVRRAIELP